MPDPESSTRPGPAPARPSAAPPAPVPAVSAVPAGVGVLLALLALPGAGVLLAGVVAAQVLLTVAVLRLLRVPGRGGSLLIAAAACAGADVLALRGDGQGGGDPDGLAAVVALALVAALLHQLLRRDGRPRVTASLAGTLLAVLLGTGAACLVALRALPEGAEAAPAGLAAAAVALLVPRYVRGQSGREPLGGVAASLLSLVAAAAVAAGTAALLDARVALPPGRAALLGLAAAGAALLARAVAEHAAVPPRRAGADGAAAPAAPAAAAPAAAVTAPPGRRATALAHVAALLPYAVLGPVALVAGRLAA